MIGSIGPKEQWRAEIDKANKIGLLDFIDYLVDVYGPTPNRESLLAAARYSRWEGSFESKFRSYQKWRADPKRALETERRRQTSAKKAARRRKKERRAA